jgi:hypothetical protein
MYTGLQIQTSSSAIPIAIVYGVNKVSFNIVWTGGFFAVPQYAQKNPGGKGGSGSGQALSGYSYYDSLVMGLCEGPIASIETVWSGQSTTTAPALGLTLFKGTTPQIVWGFMTARFPNEALPYGGLAYLGAHNFSLGSSANLPSLNFEVHGRLADSCVVNGYDADPALIVQDFLTNSQYGAGFPAASIDATTLLGSLSDSSYQTYCQALGLAISPALVNQETANGILSRWLTLTNTAAVWSGGKLKFIPYGDGSVARTLLSGEFVRFNPNITPIYNLADDDFVLDGDNDPVQATRTDPYLAHNWQTIEMSQRSNDYSSTPIEAWDQNSIELYGLRRASTITAREICDPAVAQVSAQLMLQRGQHVRNTYAFKLSFEYCLLEPMDLVTLTDVGLGLDSAAVRISSIEEDDAGHLSVVAEEFPAGVASAVAYPVQVGSNSSINRSAAPPAVNPPIIFEPGPAASGGLPQVWIALSGGAAGIADPNWGGAIVNISLDNTAYRQIGQVNGPARQGVLTAAIEAPMGANPDVTNGLSVSLADSAGTLATATYADARNGVTLSIVDSELLAYATATLTGANAYDLTYLERGLYGSTPTAHLAGAPFARLDDAIFKYELPGGYIGTPLYLKFQSFNIFGESVQDIWTCAAYVYTPTGAGKLGPIAQAMSVGANLDYGLASSGVNESDDFGLASDPYSAVLDLGLASA